MKVSSAENAYFTSVSISPVVMGTPSVNLRVTWYDSEGLGSAGYLNPAVYILAQRILTLYVGNTSISIVFR